MDPPSTLVRSTGEHALGIAIAMREGGNNIALGEQVAGQIKRFEQRYPHGIEFALVNFSPAEVAQKVNDFVLSLLQAIAVVSAVMLLALGVRTGFIVAALIPLAMLLAILIMSVFSIGLDQISLAALVIAATLQRARPILLTTATTVLGLIPLYLGDGELWEPMAIAIMAGLLFSTVLTLGVVPVLYSLLYRVRV